MVNASDRRLMLWILQSPPTTKLDGCTPEPVKSRKIGSYLPKSELQMNKKIDQNFFSTVTLVSKMRIAPGLLFSNIVIRL